jgi:hypothetical protein
MYTYEDITFIIPVKFDTKDRERNLILSVNWLNKIYPFKFIIQESDVDKKFSKIERMLPMSNINYSFYPQLTILFHRTLLLNNMLDMVSTKLVCNFDCDVIMESKNIEAVLEKFNKGEECVYPYTFGDNCLRIKPDAVVEGACSTSTNFYKFVEKFNNKEFIEDPHTSLYGYAVFFNTDVYKNGYGENENFQAWGPEDVERYERFKKLGFRVSHLDNTYKVYHLEHGRGIDSSDSHKMVRNNHRLTKNLGELDRKRLEITYKQYDYVKSRNYGKF